MNLPFGCAATAIGESSLMTEAFALLRPPLKLSTVYPRNEPFAPPLKFATKANFGVSDVVVDVEVVVGVCQNLQPTAKVQMATTASEPSLLIAMQWLHRFWIDADRVFKAAWVRSLSWVLLGTNPSWIRTPRRKFLRSGPSALPRISL